MLIVIKEKGTVYIGADAVEMPAWLPIEDTINEENLPMWKEGSALLAVSGWDIYARNLLRFANLSHRQQANMNAVINKLMPAMKELLGKYDQLDEDGESWVDLVFAKGGKCIYVDKKFYCREVTDEYVRGGSDEVARASLMLTRGEDPVQRIQKAFAEVGKYAVDRMFPAVVMNTKNNECIILKDS